MTRQVNVKFADSIEEYDFRIFAERLLLQFQWRAGLWKNFVAGLEIVSARVFLFWMFQVCSAHSGERN